MFKFFKKHEPTTYWMVDDDTVMPIACDSYEEALEIVNKYFDGEVERIYKTTK